MLFSILVGILAFIGFSGVVCMVILDPYTGVNKNATIVVGAVVGVVVLAFILTSFGMGFAGVVWASFGVVSLGVGAMALLGVV